MGSLRGIVPWGYLIGTILCTLGLILVIVNEIKFLILVKYFNMKIVEDDKVFPRLTTTFFEVLVIGMTIILVVLVTTVAYLRRNKAVKGRKRNATGSLFFGLILLLSFVFHLIWCFKACWSTYFFALNTTDKQTCSDFFQYTQKRDRYLLCITMAFAGNRTRRRICDADVIKQFCYSFASSIWLIEFVYAIGCFLIVSGLSMYMCCLSMKYRESRIYQKLNEEAGQDLAVAGRAVWMSDAGNERKEEIK